MALMIIKFVEQGCSGIDCAVHKLHPVSDKNAQHFIFQYGMVKQVARTVVPARESFIQPATYLIDD